MGSELASKHVFLSYSHEDAQMMARIRSALESMGVRVWSDEGLLPGTESWKSTIESKIRDASGIVVILSPSANRSEWVERELDYASVHGVKIFPVLVRGKPGESIPIELINAQWIDLRDEDGFSSQIQKLVLALEGKPGQGTILQTFELSKESIRRMYTKVPKEARVIITVAGVLILAIIVFFILLAIISAILSALINIRLLTPREVPQAKTLHYLFIVDSSDRMAQAFPGGQSKWTATRQSVLDHLVLGLPPRANYSLITLGGKSLPHTGSCKQRESNLIVPIGSDNRDEVLAGFEKLEPGGVAPLDDALEKAREILFNLPADEEKALYLFLGGGDDCAEDHWKSLKYFLEDSAQHIDARIEIVV